MRILLLCLLLTLPAASVAGGLVDRYTTLAFRESPYAPHRGLHRISAAEAGKVNHYRFEYDEQGRIAQISFRLGEQLRAPNHTANYFWYASAEHYRYQGDEQIVSYRDEHNRPTTVHGEVYQSRYRLDEAGRRVALRYEDRDGAGIESRWQIARYEWRHLDDGSVLEQRFGADGEPVPLRPGFPFAQVRLSYGVSGLTMLMQQVDARGQVIAAANGFAQDRFSYTVHGELARYDVLDASGGRSASNMQGIASGLLSFTERGYEHIASYLDGQNQPAYNDNGWWQSERRYDAYGNLVLNAFADRDGQRSVNPNTGYAELRLQWHDDGLRRRGLAYFDAQGEPVEHRSRGFHAIHYRYDEHKRLQLVYLLDRQQRLVEHAEQGWAVTRYHYAEDGAIGEPERLGLKAAQSLEWQHTLSQLQQFSGVPGMAAAVAEDGTLVWHGEAGLADLTQGKAVQADTQFRLASVSKAVTSILVAQALDQGSVRLDESASERVALAHPATLAQLLAHSGGVDHYNALISVDLDRDYGDSRDALAVVHPHLLSTAPGQRYRYSTFGYTVVGAMLEAASGQRFAELLRALGKQQGLDSLAASQAETDNPLLTHFYAVNGNRTEPARPRNFSYAEPGAGIIANASDLAVLVSRFAGAQLSEGATVERLLQVQQLADGSEIIDQRYAVALGWRRQADASGRIYYHHGGVTDGARSVVMFDPQTSRAVAVLANAAWSSDVFAIALSFLSLGQMPGAAFADAAGSLTADTQRLALEPVRCDALRCATELLADGDLGRWLARAQREPRLRLEQGLLGSRLYSAYGVSPFVVEPDGDTVAVLGSRRFQLR